MKYNEIKRLQQLAGIITEIKVNNPNISDDDIVNIYYKLMDEIERLIEIENNEDNFGIENQIPILKDFEEILLKYYKNFYYGMDIEGILEKLNIPQKNYIYNELEDLTKEYNIK